MHLLCTVSKTLRLLALQFGSSHYLRLPRTAAAAAGEQIEETNRTSSSNSNVISYLSTAGKM